METTLTAEEELILIEAYTIKQKRAWLAMHPGKTRRDWSAAIRKHDSELKEWMRARAVESINRERRDWLEDHPGKTAEDYAAARKRADTDADKALAEWRIRRAE